MSLLSNTGKGVGRKCFHAAAASKQFENYRVARLIKSDKWHMLNQAMKFTHTTAPNAHLHFFFLILSQAFAMPQRFFHFESFENVFKHYLKVAFVGNRMFIRKKIFVFIFILFFFFFHNTIFFSVLKG